MRREKLERRVHLDGAIADPVQAPVVDRDAVGESVTPGQLLELLNPPLVQGLKLVETSKHKPRVVALGVVRRVQSIGRPRGAEQSA
jgi:hypothetical protein